MFRQDPMPMKQYYYSIFLMMVFHHLTSTSMYYAPTVYIPGSIPDNIMVFALVEFAIQWEKKNQ